MDKTPTDYLRRLRLLSSATSVNAFLRYAKYLLQCYKKITPVSALVEKYPRSELLYVHERAELP